MRTQLRVWLARLIQIMLSYPLLNLCKGLNPRPTTGPTLISADLKSRNCTVYNSSATGSLWLLFHRSDVRDEAFDLLRLQLLFVSRHLVLSLCCDVRKLVIRHLPDFIA